MWTGLRVYLLPPHAVKHADRTGRSPAHICLGIFCCWILRSRDHPRGLQRLGLVLWRCFCPWTGLWCGRLRLRACCRRLSILCSLLVRGGCRRRMPCGYMPDFVGLTPHTFSRRLSRRGSQRAVRWCSGCFLHKVWWSARWELRGLVYRIVHLLKLDENTATVRLQMNRQ